MESQLQNKVELFIQNVGGIKNSFIWQEPAAKRLAALIYTMEGKTLDPQGIKEARDLIKEQTGIFSTFRGNLSIYIAAALSLTQDPKRTLEDVLYVHSLLKGQRFWSSDYLVAAAYEIAIHSPRENYAMAASRTRAFYDEMKSNHRFHIGEDDYIFAAMLALSDLDPHQGAVKMKLLFQKIKGEFSAFISRGSMLHLAQMMALGGSTPQCVANISHLNRVFRSKKIKLDRTFTLPVFGVLGLLDIDHHTLAQDILDVRDFLRKQKGFGHFSISNDELFLYVVSLVVNGYTQNHGNQAIKASATSGVTSLIIAQQVALIVAISVSTTAAAAASSGC